MMVKSCGNATIKGVISAIMIICWGRALSQQTLRFSPTTYSHVFSAQPVPVLRIKQGDTVHTTSVDAGGLDFATTLNTLVPKMLPKSTAMKTWRSAKLLRWKLDLEKSYGKAGKPGYRTRYTI
jgi:hypothetical protein